MATHEGMAAKPRAERPKSAFPSAASGYQWIERKLIGRRANEQDWREEKPRETQSQLCQGPTETPFFAKARHSCLYLAFGGGLLDGADGGERGKDTLDEGVGEEEVRGGEGLSRRSEKATRGGQSENTGDGRWFSVNPANLNGSPQYNL